jgi:hypothetical protein
VSRIHAEHAGGKSLGEIARSLNASGIPTAHGGARWWPSTVRAILARESHAAAPPPSPPERVALRHARLSERPSNVCYGSTANSTVVSGVATATEP